MVLVTASFIDEQLKEILATFFISLDYGPKLLDGGNAPLGTFSSRITLAAALALISESEYKNCEYIRKIRNEFAHSITTSFDDQKIKDLCTNLSGYPDDIDDARSMYSMTVIGLANGFYNRAHYVGKARPKFSDWPY